MKFVNAYGPGALLAERYSGHCLLPYVLLRPIPDYYRLGRFGVMRRTVGRICRVALLMCPLIGLILLVSYDKIGLGWEA